MHFFTKGRLSEKGKKRQPCSVWSSSAIILLLSKNCFFSSLHVHIAWLWSALEIAWKGIICVGRRMATLTETTVMVHSSCWRTKWHLLCTLGLHHTTTVLVDGIPGSKQMVVMQIQDIYQPWSWSTARNSRNSRWATRLSVKGIKPEACRCCIRFLLFTVGVNQVLTSVLIFLQGEFYTKFSLQGTRATPSSRHLFLLWYHWRSELSHRVLSEVVLCMQSLGNVARVAAHAWKMHVVRKSLC